MPSNAFRSHLEVLLRDAEELEQVHRKLRTGNVGRQWGLGALNRGVVVLAVSAWESYVEELVREAVSAFRPPAGTQQGLWPTLNANARSQIGRFNNPNPQNVQTLLSETIGLPDVTLLWSWQGVDVARARQRLEEALKTRHEIAHGVNPRPTVHNQYAKRLPPFFLRLGRCTDRAVRTHLVDALNVPNPWSQ